MRTLEEILEMLQESAEIPDYFEIGPEESRLLWAEIIRLRAAGAQEGDRQ